ncbi:solute carrier family 26 member 6-like isoform X2 [Ranitomeya imitator]|uniref:solute carrier family 26 member 6-like isoform X2 n=1 Tax=Ranitomeya imitator TaxID=111125 RepID=UPI0037E9629D
MRGLAYALLSGVPAVLGLYSSFYPVILYTIFGTSRHISPGTFAVISVMVGSVTESLAPSDNFMIPVNESMVLDTVARDAARIQVATALTLLVGIFQILLGLVQFGFVVTYLSEPLVRGYTTAAAIHVTLSQLKSILGVEISQRSHPLSLIYTIVNLCAKIPQTNVASLLIAVIAIIFMLTVKFLNEKYMAKIRIPIPIELITLIVATGISYGVNLNTMYGVNIVGDIPTGLKAPSVPRIDLLYSVIGNAFAIAVVVYAFTVSLVKMFAVKHGYNVDSNQELIALGISNSVGSFFQCFTIGTAMSRSLVQENTGGNSQIAGAVSSLVILIIILKAGELFESLPKAILASVVVVNLKGIYKQFMDIPALWRSNKIDLMVWLVTFVATILLNLDLGLGVSVAFSLLTIIFRTQWPHYSLLGQVSSTDIYRDVTQYKQALEIPGVKIFRSSCTLYFANAELYANAVKKMCGVDVDKLIAIKKKEAKKKKQLQEKAEKEAKKGLKEKENRNDGNVKGHELEYIYPRSPAVGEAETDRVVVEESTLNNVGSNEWPLHSLILDLSTVNFVDTVSIKILKNIFRDFEEIDVSVYLVGCHENVLEQLERGNFFSKTITKYLLFSSIHDAVTYISINYCKKPGEERLHLSTRI